MLSSILPCYLAILALLATVSAEQRSPHLAVLQKRAPKYCSVVAFGASYQDNAHARASKYKQYQRPWPYSAGRFTNGPVMIESLAKTYLKAPLIDYAYGESHFTS